MRLPLALPLLLIISTSLGEAGYSPANLGPNYRAPSVGSLPAASGLRRPTRTVETVHQWRQLEYGFASEQDRQKAQADGNLMADNGTPIDVQPHYLPNGQVRVFTTVPRFVTGIPYTLATVSDQLGSNGPQLQPYPSFNWHNNNGDNCDQITSAFRVAVSS